MSIQQKNVSKVFVNIAIYIRHFQRSTLFFLYAPAILKFPDTANPSHTWYSVRSAKPLSNRARWRFFQSADGKTEGWVIHQPIHRGVRSPRYKLGLVLNNSFQTSALDWWRGMWSWYPHMQRYLHANTEPYCFGAPLHHQEQPLL